MGGGGPGASGGRTAWAGLRRPPHHPCTAGVGPSSPSPAAQAPGPPRRLTAAEGGLEDVERRHPHAQADLSARLRQALGDGPAKALRRGGGGGIRKGGHSDERGAHACMHMQGWNDAHAGCSRIGLCGRQTAGGQRAGHCSAASTAQPPDTQQQEGPADLRTWSSATPAMKARLPAVAAAGAAGAAVGNWRRLRALFPLHPAPCHPASPHRAGQLADRRRTPAR